MKEYMTAIHSMEDFQEAAAKGGVSVFTFSANWCPDCRFIEPFMPKLVEAFSDYTFYYVDRDENIDICQALMVMGIPSFVAYKDGKESGRFVSKLRKTEKEINDFLAAQKWRKDDDVCQYLKNLQAFCLKKRMPRFWQRMNWNRLKSRKSQRKQRLLLS